MKTCMNCRENFDLTEFHKDRTSRDGFQRRCKPCNSQIVKEWREKNPEKNRSTIKNWQKANPERMAANSQRYFQAKKRKTVNRVSK